MNDVRDKLREAIRLLETGDGAVFNPTALLRSALKALDDAHARAEQYKTALIHHAIDQCAGGVGPRPAPRIPRRR